MYFPQQISKEHIQKERLKELKVDPQCYAKEAVKTKHSLFIKRKQSLHEFQRKHRSIIHSVMTELCWLSLCLTVLKSNFSLLDRFLELNYRSRNELYSSVKEVYAVHATMCKTNINS